MEIVVLKDEVSREDVHLLNLLPASMVAALPLYTESIFQGS